MHPRFAEALRERGLGEVVPRVRRFPDATRTAEEAAAAIGCELSRICKSLVFAATGVPTGGPGRDIEAESDPGPEDEPGRGTRGEPGPGPEGKSGRGPRGGAGPSAQGGAGPSPGAGEPVVVLVDGASRVDTELLRRALGAEAVARATARQVRESTGYAIGGVPPFGHRTAVRVLADRTLLAHGTVWAAAGTPHAVFPMDPRSLVAHAGGTVVDVREQP